MAATTGPYASPGAPPAAPDSDRLRCELLLSELQRLVARLDQYEHLGHRSTRISTLFPLREAARAVLHPNSAREGRAHD